MLYTLFFHHQPFEVEAISPSKDLDQFIQPILVREWEGYYSHPFWNGANTVFDPREDRRPTFMFGISPLRSTNSDLYKNLPTATRHHQSKAYGIMSYKSCYNPDDEFQVNCLVTMCMKCEVGFILTIFDPGGAVPTFVLVSHQFPTPSLNTIEYHIASYMMQHIWWNSLYARSLLNTSAQCGK